MGAGGKSVSEQRVLCQPGKWSGNERSGISEQGAGLKAAGPELPQSLALPKDGTHRQGFTRCSSQGWLRSLGMSRAFQPARHSRAPSPERGPGRDTGWGGTGGHWWRWEGPEGTEGLGFIPTLVLPAHAEGSFPAEPRRAEPRSHGRLGPKHGCIGAWEGPALPRDRRVQ